ncbi:cobalt-precorrin-5B (C(1))-methyltransferase CbiD [Caloramator sp. CAR-1]|uniref:cobalt-precorrin-5B (C(1))-methyltransferase CbiD n=1 Tax=Caloramator sp. CAR-1 TaxID=3062777 RepID=UPI0026E13DF9|nr:cobalt-precorrin-5B (C(1))-methyltransferase CbiD [Caloramator sp. CAR-1]MDO6353650.1 cobalt-precorrin-5B (C(1))-methyltransferase CbiD [Caloramator sp. CAR-1]
MMEYVIHEGKKLRLGYTTGSCAAAATKAALLKLLGVETKFVEIKTPEGITLKIKVIECFKEGEFAVASVKKDAGDDVDVTDKIKIYSKVKLRQDGKVNIDGGIGIGRFIEDSPFGKKGEVAINKVPREMIKEAVMEVYPKGADVLIFAPDGIEIAKKTYNPKIGIVGGISIIGTKGIVYPMSDDAMKKTIYMQLDILIRKSNQVIFTFGNHGEEFVKKNGIKGDIIKTSNYIGDALLYAKEVGFKKITIVGHIGKMCKLSIGAFNTHSKVVDSRMEAFVYYLAKKRCPYEIIQRVEKFKTAEEVAAFIKERGYDVIFNDMKQGIIDRIRNYISDYDIELDVIIYTFKDGRVVQ